MARGSFFRDQKFQGMFGPDVLNTLQRELNRTFDDLWRSLPQSATGEAAGPSVRTFGIDLSETDTLVRVRAELPGVAEGDVDVTLDEDKLTIAAERRAEQRGAGETAHHAEIGAVTYRRSIRLPSAVDPDHVDARMERGVLTITLHKPRAADRGRKIPVRGTASTAGAAATDTPASAGWGIDPGAVATGSTTEAFVQSDGAGGASSTGGGAGSTAPGKSTTADW